uniref:Myb/SANT-like domain-containing protein n=1 Tax=Setaria italica TaxID=4555 RepID=K3YMG4_SETIT
MEPEIFKATTDFLRRENLLHDTRGVAVEKQIGMFMAIGVLKKRFPILKIAAVAIAFHNIIRGKNGQDGWLDDQPEYIPTDQFVDVPKGDNNYPSEAEAAWNSAYEKKGRRIITSKFNEKFPVAHFTKKQVQEKEKELKANYKALRDAKRDSGNGWNESLCMILTEPKV